MEHSKHTISLSVFLACAICLAFTSCAKNAGQDTAGDAGVSRPDQGENYAVALQQLADGDLSKALETVDQQINAGVDTAEIRNLRGIIHQQNGEHELAKADFDRATALDATNAEFYNNRALSLQILGDNTGAEEDFDKAITLQPDFAVAHFNLGILLYAQEDYPLAVAALEKAASLDPSDSDTWFQLGLAYDRIGMTSKAIDSFSRVIELEQGFDDQPYYLRGLAYAEQGQVELAEADFNTAIDKGLRNADTFFYRGLMRYYLGQHEQALLDFDQAIVYDPQHADAYYYRSYIYARLGDQDKARESAQKALDLDPPIEDTEPSSE